MKVFGTVMKILAAVAAIAGIVYVLATYGDRMVEWAKNLYKKSGLHKEKFFYADESFCKDDEPEEESAEEAEEVPADTADDADFAN